MKIRKTKTRLLISMNETEAEDMAELMASVGTNSFNPGEYGEENPRTGSNLKGVMGRICQKLLRAGCERYDTNSYGKPAKPLRKMRNVNSSRNK